MIARVVDAASAMDREVFRRVAHSDLPVIDAAVPRITSSADQGLLWFAVAALLALTGRRGRRAAVRGLMSLSVASGVANGPAKWLVRRRRPQLVDVPVVRQLSRQPRTTSFPSGHSASAAAFATGVALEAPLAAIPVAALAAAVAYGRVHTGVHYPSDVVAGVALGAGAAVVVRRVWPTAPERTAAAEAPASEAPALPDGDGLVLVVNASAQSQRVDADALRREVLARLPRTDVVVCGDDDDIAAALAEAAARARVLGVAGGDGTVSCAAGVAVEHGLPLLVVPAGTLNHFAGELGVRHAGDACDALATGAAIEVSVATAGDGLSFLNTFSLGLYPELVARREKRERVLGKWPALAVALIEVLRHARPMPLCVDGTKRSVWLLFGGNGRYHPSGFAPSWRERLDEAVLDVRVVDAAPPLARTRLVAAVLTGRLGRSRVYDERIVEQMTIEFDEDVTALARDGESQDAPRRLTLRSDRRLVVYRPPSS